MGLGIWMLFLFLPSIIFCSACLEEERNSLLDFKQARQLIEPLESWRGLNCCSWEGVGCHPRTAHVITLDLSLLEYSIQWSEVRGGLFQLLHLEHLDLSYYNYFTSLSIPPQIGGLRRLKYLSLDYCEFRGQIPREVTKLQKLEHLDLSANDLHGAIPREMGNISTLKFLSLSFNDGLQSNKLGEWLSHLRGLEHLELSSMNLTMAEDTWLGGYLLSLANLTVLSMGNCGLSGEIPPFFANLSRLQQLELWGNSFRGNIPAFLGTPLLSSLDLSENNLEGSIPSSLSTLSNLWFLDLSSNKLNGSIPPALGNLSALNYLQLQNNSLTGPIPTSFAKLPRLEFLDLANNRLNGTFSFFILNNCTKLYGLDLSSNTLTVKISASIIPKFQLHYLALRECNVGGSFPAFISTQYSIRSLDLSNNSHSGFIPDWLWGFTDIEYIDLSDNLFDGSIIRSIDKYTQNL